MIRLSLKYRIAATIFLLEIVMVSSVLWITLSTSLSRTQESLNESGIVIVDLMAELGRTALITEEYLELQPFITESLRDSHATRVILTDYKGRIVAASEEGMIGINQPPVENSKDHFWIQKDINILTGKLGTLLVQFSNAALHEAYYEARNQGITIAAIGMTTIAIIGLVMGFLLTRRLEILTSVARRFAEGDLDASSNLKGNDEVAQLSKTFDSMGAQIKTDIRRITESEERFRTLVNTAESVILFLDPDGMILEFNKAAEKLFGKRREEVLGTSYVDQFLPEEAKAAVITDLEKVLSGHPTKHFENDVIAADNSLHTFVWYVNRVPGESGLPLGIVAFGYDVTDMRKTEKSLKRKEMQQELLLNSLPMAFYTSTSSTNNSIQTITGRIEDITGYSPSDFINDTGLFRSRIHPDDKGTLSEAIENLPINKDASIDYRWQHANGTYRWFHDQFVLSHEGNGTPIIIGNLRDITDEKLADLQMEKLSSALEQSADIVVITNEDGIIEYTNPAFEEITGYTNREVIGKKTSIIKSGKHDNDFYKKLWDTILNGNVYQDVVINRKKNDEIYYEEKTITPLFDKSGNITHFISTGKDITERMQTQERLYHLAYHDILTELPNRALFMDRLTHALYRKRGSDEIMAILFIDVDRFKNINDTLGHDIGDKLLSLLATRIVECLRKGDTVARLSGDEFVVLLEEVGSHNYVSSICNKILENVLQAFDIDSHELFASVSMGISLYPDDGSDATSLMKNADIAMYRAKEKGRNNYQFYSADMSVEAVSRLNLETSLRHALDRNEFLLYYQPQISLITGSVVGIEALLRWQHPELGLVPPGQFIVLLEETGMISQVGEWVLKEAIQQLKLWQDAGINSISVSVNLSGRQFDEAVLPKKITRMLDSLHLEPNYLELEITESLLMRNTSQSLKMLQELSDVGVRLSIDDFGTGYSSLSYLKRFPINTLKIDRSFIRDVTSNPDDTAIVKAIIAMARSLRLDVIAEGVETQEQLMFLKDQNCSCVQGFLYSKPLPADEMKKFLQGGDKIISRVGQ